MRRDNKVLVKYIVMRRVVVRGGCIDAAVT